VDPYYYGRLPEATSAPDGGFSIGPFSDEEVKLEITAEGFKALTRKFALRERIPDEEVRLELADGSGAELESHAVAAETVRIVGSVVDGESGEPLPVFRVLLNDHRGGTPSLVGDGRSGRFDWPVEMIFHEKFSLEVHAGGYEPARSDVRPVRSGMQDFEFRMRRGGGSLRGVVRGPTGQPVSGALVGLTGLGFGFHLEGARAFSGDLALQAITGTDGRFSIPLRPNTESLCVVHEAGFAQMAVGDVPKSGIVLQPWGAIEGVVLTAGQPASGQVVSLQTWPPQSDSDPHGVVLQGLATSDASGRFRFDRVPPGVAAVSRYYKFSPGTAGRVGHGPRQRVEVAAGSVTEVTVGTIGRAVTGRLALSSPVPGHQWRDDLQRLEEIRDDLPPVAAGAPGMDPQDPEWVRRIRAHARREAQVRKFFPDVQPDGAFRMEDVPPGSYTFQLRVSRPPTDPEDEDQRYFRPELGKLSVPVVVPQGDEPLDLGTITIPVKAR